MEAVKSAAEMSGVSTDIGRVKFVRKLPKTEGQKKNRQRVSMAA